MQGCSGIYVLHNLKISLHILTILRSRNYSAQSQDSENVQHNGAQSWGSENVQCNLKIAQIRGTI